jgi:3'-phosphoadenosine 5'-phosphosulfate sulfotransferase (PAPS reductase)/FAD synthetase
MNIECMRAKYKLPGDVDKDAYILPVSGGADSTYLAILLIQMFPDAPWKLVFTDTGEEHESILTQLDRLEFYLGRKIERLGDETLFGLVERWGGFLPSPAARYCTNELKAKPFKAWLKNFDGQKKWMFIGIRSDERQRLAFTIPDAETEMPYIDLGIVREDVYRGLNATIGIPKMYETRTRSGCWSCPFQTRSERVGLLQHHPIQFYRAGKVEKLGAGDEERQAPAPKLSKETGISENWMSLPQPKDGSKIEGKRPSKEASLFGDRGIYVGAEMFYDDFCGIDPFVWHQRVVTYSPTLSGLTKQLQRRYEHLLSTAEVFDMTQKDVRTRVKFAVYYIEAPEEVLDLAGPADGTYTWHQGESYRQLSHVVSWATRVLHAHTMQQEAATIDKVSPISWAFEVAYESVKGLAKVTNPTGQVAAMGWHECHEPVEDEEIEESEVTCPMCSL